MNNKFIVGIDNYSDYKFLYFKAKENFIYYTKTKQYKHVSRSTFMNDFVISISIEYNKE